MCICFQCQILEWQHVTSGVPSEHYFVDQHPQTTLWKDISTIKQRARKEFVCIFIFFVSQIRGPLQALGWQQCQKKSDALYGVNTRLVKVSHFQNTVYTLQIYNVLSVKGRVHPSFNFIFPDKNSPRTLQLKNQTFDNTKAWSKRMKRAKS